MGRILASMLLTAASLGVAMGQQADHEKHHQAEQPKEGKMGSMMPMMESMRPMMMEMHQRHMSQGNQWTATDEAVFVLQGDKLLKYDADLKLAKQVDLPKGKSEASGEHTEHHSSAKKGKKKEKSAEGKEGMQKMKMKMMSQMHRVLARKIQATPDAVFVSQGNMLLKYDHELTLQARTQPPEQKAMKCPMCEQMMKQKNAEAAD